MVAGARIWRHWRIVDVVEQARSERVVARLAVALVLVQGDAARGDERPTALELRRAWVEFGALPADVGNFEAGYDAEAGGVDVALGGGYGKDGGRACEQN